MDYQRRETALQRQVDAMMAQARDHIPTQDEKDQYELRIIKVCNGTEQAIRDGRMVWTDENCLFGMANDCLDANRKLQPRVTGNLVTLHEIDASIKFWHDFTAQSSARGKDDRS